MGGATSSCAVDEDLLSSIKQLKHATNAEDGGLLGRKDEMSQLINLLAGEPSRVTLLIGPKNSGKSKLLLHLKEIWQADSEIRQIFAPCILINLRECLSIDLREGSSYSPAEGLVKDLRLEVMAWHDMATEVLRKGSFRSISSISKESIALGLESFPKGLGYQLDSILDRIQTFLKCNPHVRPVIILDEANVLKTWCSYWKLKEEVAKLARFFLWLSKETGKGHVLMASSAAFFWSWLSETLEFTDLKIMPIDHFNEYDAKKLIVNHIIPKHDGFLPAEGFNDDVWKSIYQVTRGSPHLLKIAVSDAIEIGSWADALESMVSTKVEYLREQLLGNHYWSFAHLEGIVGEIVNGGGLAGFDDVIAHVFSGNELKGRQLVTQLVEKNIIHVRLWTRGVKYKDLGEKRGNHTLYLMAIDPASFVAMRQLYPSWFAMKTQDAATIKRSGRENENTRGREKESAGGEGDWDYSEGEGDWDYE